MAKQQWSQKTESSLIIDNTVKQVSPTKSVDKGQTNIEYKMIRNHKMLYSRGKKEVISSPDISCQGSNIALKSPTVIQSPVLSALKKIVKSETKTNKAQEKVLSPK